MIYIRVCLDAPGSLDLRYKLRDKRRAYLDSLGGKMVQGGPLCAGDKNDAYIGTFMLIEAESREEAMTLHEQDPFTQAGIFERSFIVRYDKHRG